MQEIFEIFRFFSIKNLSPYLIFLWQVFKHWWWLPLPFILWQRFLFLWLWWRQELWSGTQKQVLLEIKIPKEVLKPIRAMEEVFAGIHSLHDVVVWREKWIEGQFQLSVSLEIVSIGGDVHFYIRTPVSFRNVLEANVYSQYPDVEITEAEDYTRKVPQDIPNKGWDLFGFDMIATKEDPYPIRTYIKFETEKEALEEKRIDPLAGLVEGMAALKPGEQLWVQIIAKPIREEVPWVEEGEKIRDEILKREIEKKPSFLGDAINLIFKGLPPGYEEQREFTVESKTTGRGFESERTSKSKFQQKEGKKAVIPPEMKLSPGERELVEAIEEKIHKFGFSCTVRFIYLGEREVFFKPKARIPFGFFKEVSYENLGGLKPWKVTMTKSKTVFLWFWDKRREYLRKRKLFRHYIHRYPPLFPKPGGTFVLNTEEVATLYHFPGRAVAPAPAFSRIESKKGEAPPGLPTE